jgi:hypothetical protein
MQYDDMYDDGASLLGQDPYMQQVGLFGRGPKPTKPIAPPIDVQRRAILGLKPQAEYPVPAIKPTDIPVPTSSFPTPVPIQPVQQAPVSPLQSLANKAMNAPMSRREVLKKAGQATANQMLPTPSVNDVVPSIASPLIEAAKTIIPNEGPSIASMVIPAMDKIFRDATIDAMDEQMNAGDWGAGSAYEFYDDVRPHLENKISKKDLDKLDKYSNYLYESYDRMANTGRDAPKKHADTVDKFMALFNKHLHNVPMNAFFGDTEFTSAAYDKAYMRGVLEDEGFTSKEIDAYLKHHDIRDIE